MDQITFVPEDSVHGIGNMSPDLAHLQFVRCGGNASSLDRARVQVHEKQNNEALQSSPGPHFHWEEIGGHQYLCNKAETMLFPLFQCCRNLLHNLIGSQQDYATAYCQVEAGYQ